MFQILNGKKDTQNPLHHLLPIIADSHTDLCDDYGLPNENSIDAETVLNEINIIKSSEEKWTSPNYSPMEL